MISFKKIDFFSLFVSLLRRGGGWLCLTMCGLGSQNPLKVFRTTICNENSIITFKCITSISFLTASICGCLRPKIILHLFFRKGPNFTHSLRTVTELKQIFAKRQICTRAIYIFFFIPKMNRFFFSSLVVCLCFQRLVSYELF